jgi:hypothetical protein
MRRGATVLSLGGVLALGCSGGGTLGGSDGPDIRKHIVGLADPCGGFPELTGIVILDRRVDRVTGTLGFFDAQATRVDATALTIDLTWPAPPVAFCYDAVEADGVYVGPRVAIEGLTMRFVTADGTFDETLAAKAWLPTVSNDILYPLILAVTVRANLQGTWQPLPGYEGSTVNFLIPLGYEISDSYPGTVGLGRQMPAELDAAIFGERAMVASW